MHLIVAVLSILIIGFGIFFIYYLNKNLNDYPELCDPINKTKNHNDILTAFYMRYTSFRISVSSLIDLALIGSTYFVVRLLKRDVPKHYSQEIFRVRCIYITFIIAYST